MSELGVRLNEYVSRMRAGDEVLLTEAGVPVARLLRLTVPQPAPAGIGELVRAGQARLPIQQLSREFVARLPRVEDPQGAVPQALLEERQSNW